MSVTTFTRWKGGNEAEIIAAAKLAREFMIKHGAEAVRLDRFHNAQFIGEWLVQSRYPDWTTYGKAQDGLANDPGYQAMLAKVMGMAQLMGRTTLVGYNIE